MYSSHVTFFTAVLAFGFVGIVTADDQSINYSRDVRPILSSRCFACHGPDAVERKADLRLDTSDAVAADGVIKPGKADASELIARLISTDPETQMPPPASKKPKLTAAEVEVLRKWINQGAKYDAHWAYVKPTRPNVPEVKQTAWPSNAIDRFVLRQMELNSVSPAADADRRTLARRLSFDIRGLPPTAEEVATFLADQSPQAYEKYVDRLVASEQFGERMAMYWLDVVRYADTAGYHSDNHRDIALYRDYVIRREFNENKPFDQFTTEQLAGDLLPNATNEQKIASGYNKLLQTTEEGGAEAKEYTAKYMSDRVRNTAVIWLASTMGCCECHNHKFDPFTMKDFYTVGAFFADVSETAVGRQATAKIPTAEQLQRQTELDQQIAALKGELTTVTPELKTAQAAWETKKLQELSSGQSTWQPTKPEQAISEGKQTLTVQDDLAVLASGENPAKDVYTVTLPLAEKKLTAIRLEALTHESLTNKSLSRGNGNFVLTEFSTEAVTAEGKKTKLKLVKPVASFNQPNQPITGAIDGKPETGWATAGHEKAADQQAMFVLDKPLEVAAGTKLLVTLKFESQYPQHHLGRFRLSLTEVATPTLTGNDLPGTVLVALQIPAEKRTPAEATAVAEHFRSISQELAPLREKLAAREKEKTDLANAFPATLVTVAASPRMVRILPRGNWQDDTGEVVQPAPPAFLSKSPPPTDKRLMRLDFAQWMVAAENPLPARVFVNRLWKLAFGRGIVKTMDDFGLQGQLPTHPELLDWLAVDFQESGWNIKRAFKQMLLSHAYQQSSLVTTAAAEHDPNNELFSRQNRFRVDAEMVRDNALAVSGLLSFKIGGPSVKPYQPAGYWQYLNFPTREWKNDSGESLYRRGLYTYWQRTFLHPSLQAFDAPSREECVVERTRSNTPQQALVLLNDPTYVEAARVLAAVVIEKGGATPAERVKYAFRTVLQRQPADEELQTLVALVERHQQQYAQDHATAEKLLQVGEAKPPASMEKSELAAWTSVSRVLLNLHETVTRN